MDDLREVQEGSACIKAHLQAILCGSGHRHRDTLAQDINQPIARIFRQYIADRWSRDIPFGTDIAREEALLICEDIVY